ncbi:MAG: HD domain-containing protein [Patescibacteria group bacterium]|jgi:putative nucleotidyltransferase with HDIG domain
MSELLEMGVVAPVKKPESPVEDLDPKIIAGQKAIMGHAHNLEVNGKADTREFVDYFDTSVSLEDRVQTDLDELQVAPNKREAIHKYLDLIKDKHQSSYEHSLRVGLIARQIAKFMGIDEKVLLYAGLLHDVGKTMVPASTLLKTEGWTPEDTANVQAHVESGYKLLRDKFDFTAEVILRHHRFQTRPYPEELPKSLHEYSEDTKTLINEYGRILAMADVYDALHRINDKHGVKRALNGEEIHEQMLSLNPDRTELVEKLYAAGVFTTNIQ